MYNGCGIEDNHYMTNAILANLAINTFCCNITLSKLLISLSVMEWSFNTIGGEGCWSETFWGVLDFFGTKGGENVSRWGGGKLDFSLTKFSRTSLSVLNGHSFKADFKWPLL